MKLVRVCVPLLVLACTGDQQPIGQIVVIAQALTATAQITRVTVTVAPAGGTFDLTANPQEPGTFTARIAVPVGTLTLTARAFSGTTPVGTGTATVSLTKGAQLQAFITILDATGPAPVPDHSPVVTSLVVPGAAEVGDQTTVNATAMDGDGDQMSFSWDASPAGCGSFASPGASTTIFTAQSVGACTVTFTSTANGKSASRSLQVQIGPATGTIDVTVEYVPQPVISSISFSLAGTPVATVARNATDATIRTPFHQGTTYTVTISFDPWPTGTVALTDSCQGTIQPQPLPFVPSATSATATWTPTVNSGACIVTATVTRQGLSDSLFVVVLPGP